MTRTPLRLYALADNDMGFALAPTPATLIARLASVVMPPSDLSGRCRFQAIAGHLGRGDGARVARMLGHPGTGPGGVYGELPNLVLTVLAVEGLAHRGWALPEETAVLQVIRRQVRAELMRLPLGLSGSWLVPNTPREITQAHVGALLLSRQGDLVRPWMWPGVPEQGSFMLIGAAASNHPALANGQCRGATDFLLLAQRTGMTSDAVMDATAGVG